MKAFVALSSLAFVAACASPGEKVAAVECKIYPATTASATGMHKPNVDSIEQRHAAMQLGTVEFRMRHLWQNGYHVNTVEDALRDCAAR